MATSAVVKTKRDGTITLGENGAFNASTAADVAMKNLLELDCEVGDWSMSVSGPSVNAFMDRGQFGATPKVRYGDDNAITGSFSGYYLDVGDAAAAESVFADAVVRTAGSDIVANWESTLGSAAEVPLFMLRYTTDDGTDITHTVLNHVHLTAEISEGDPNTVNFSWTAYQTVPTLVLKA